MVHGVSGATAPLSKLGAQELTNVARYLDFRDLTLLYATGCLSIWSTLTSSITEMRFTTPITRFTPLHRSNPFPALSKLPMLHTVILQRVCYSFRSEEHDGKSPFLSLPPTLRHLEFEETTPKNLPIEFSSSKRVPNPPHDVNWIADIDYGKAFPQLQRLRIFLREVPKARLHPRWASTLPPTLEALSICNIGFSNEIMYFICGSEDALDINPTLLGLPADTRRLPTFPAVKTLPLPSLSLLHILDAPTHLTFNVDALPPKLHDFRWIQLNAFNHVPTLPELLPQHPIQQSDGSDSSSAPSQAKMSGLQSLVLWNPRDLYWLTGQRDQLHLVHMTTPVSIQTPQDLPFTAYLQSLDVVLDSDARSFDIIATSLDAAGATLKSLTLRGKASIDPNNAIHRRVLSSLTYLHLPSLDSTSAILAATGLTTLKVSYSGHSKAVSEAELRQLPSGLTTLDWASICIELGHVPLLPRTLRHLTFSPVHGLKIGNRFVTPEIIAEASRPGLAQLYESITPESNLLFGLPPNLESLNLRGDMPIFESNFGLFLPSSLRAIHGDGRNNWCIDINAGASKPTGIASFSSWLGIPSKSVGNRLAYAIGCFPPMCISSLYFRKGGLVSKNIGIEEIRPMCNYLTHLERVDKL